MQNRLIYRVNIYTPNHLNLSLLDVLHHGYFSFMMLCFDFVCRRSNNLFLVCFMGNSYSMEFDNPERPECNNLLSIYQLISGKSKEVIIFMLSYQCGA